MRAITAVSRQLWWEVARACPYATFFHTPRWTEIACTAIPAVRDRTIAVFLPSGVRVILPLLEVRHSGLCTALLSTFEGCYGGIIADGPLTAAEATRIYRLAYRWNVTSFAYLANPLAPPETIDRTYRIGDEIAHIIQLDSDFETLFDRFSRNARGNYRRGLREDARIRRAHTIADWQAYYAAYRDAVNRWGEDETYGYPWSFFAQMFTFAQAYPHEITLWVVELDGQVVGGRLAFYWNQHVTLWHGTATRAALARRALFVLDVEIIRDAIERGLRYFDFNTSAGIAGVMQYKRNFATTDCTIPRCEYHSPLLQPLVQLAHRWQHYPIEARRVPELAPGAAHGQSPSPNPAQRA